jgi:hypothetical protein
MTGVVLAGPAVRAIEDSKVSPGVLGFLVVAALGVATWLLIRSMNRQVRKVDFDEDAVERERRAAHVPESEAAAGPTTPPVEKPGDDGQEQLPG